MATQRKPKPRGWRSSVGQPYGQAACPYCSDELDKLTHEDRKTLGFDAYYGWYGHIEAMKGMTTAYTRTKIDGKSKWQKIGFYHAVCERFFPLPDNGNE